MSSSHNARAALALIAILSFGLALHAQESPPESVRIEWAPVEGARSYEVEARFAGGPEVFRATTEASWILLPLGPGDYEIRITAYNVFKRPFSVGAWTPFSIKRTAAIEKPALRTQSLYAGAGEGELAVDAVGLLPDTKARLEGQGLSIPASSARTEGGRLFLSFDLTAARPGTYDLVLVNPGGLEARLPGAASVAQRTEPVLLSVDPPGLRNDRAYPRVAFRGSGLSEGTELSLLGPGGLVIRPSRIVSVAKDEIVAVLNMADRPAGAYDAVARNPGGLESILAAAFTVVDAMSPEPATPPTSESATPPTPEPGSQPSPEPASQPSPELEPPPTGGPENPAPTAAEPSPQAVAETPSAGEPAVEIEEPVAGSRLERAGISFYALCGWSPAFVLTPSYQTDFSLSYAGAALCAGLFPGASPWTGGDFAALSIELRVQGAFFSKPAGTGVGEAAFLPVSVEAGPCLNLGHRSGIGLRLRAAYGADLSYLYREGPLSAYRGYGFDPSLSGGLSFYWAIGSFMLELGADARSVFFVGDTLIMIQPFLSVGWNAR